MPCSETNADALMRTETVKVSGDIDVDEASALETALIGVAAPGVRIEVDLSSVTFMGSWGLRALLSGRSAAIAAGSTLAVVNASSIVCRVIAVTDLTYLYDHRDGAEPLD